MPGSILLVDDETDTLEMLADALRVRGFTVATARSGAEALEQIPNAEIDLVLTDNEMPGLKGTQLAHELAIRFPDIVTILLTGLANVDAATQALRAGVYDFLVKPVKLDHLAIVLERALEHQRLATEVKRLRVADYTTPIPSLVGKSSVLRSTTTMIRRAAVSDATVLVTGESGTGKELIARALHELSSRKSEPFVAINCSAVPSELLEAELFGSVKGAFTDAKTDRAGLFVSAGAGTIFLDEIGEMPLEMQAKLLRVLQERKVRPVGSDNEIPIRARVVAATNRDLEEEVINGRFREDLFHRLNVLAIHAPPLRLRGADILEIADVVLERIAARTKKPKLKLSREASRRMLDYPWPGNVRELENMMERIAAMAVSTDIQEADLPKKLLEHQPVKMEMDLRSPDQLASLDEVIVRYARQILVTVNGNKTHAARILGIDRRSLYRLLEK